MADQNDTAKQIAEKVRQASMDAGASCGICSRDLSHGEYVYIGTSNAGQWRAASECCISMMKHVYAGGIHVDESTPISEEEVAYLMQNHPFAQLVSERIQRENSN